MKTYRVSTSYTMEMKADNPEQAEELFLECLDTVESNWIEDCMTVEEVSTKRLCKICKKFEDEDGRCGCTNKDGK